MTITYFLDLFIVADVIDSLPVLTQMSEAVRQLINSMWIGLALGMLFVGLLGRVPREFVTSLLG